MPVRIDIRNQTHYLAKISDGRDTIIDLVKIPLAHKV